MEMCVLTGNNDLSQFSNDLFIVSHLNSELKYLIFLKKLLLQVFLGTY